MQEPFESKLEQGIADIGNANDQAESVKATIMDTEVAEQVGGSVQALMVSAQNLLNDAKLQFEKAREIYLEAVEKKDMEPNATGVNGDDVKV